jgi:1-acylglycerone phosphate reductase
MYRKIIINLLDSILEPPKRLHHSKPPNSYLNHVTKSTPLTSNVTHPLKSMKPVPMEKRTVLITGCTKGGIGYSLAKEFAALGWHVYATTRRISSMEGLSSIPNITLLELDITSRESILSVHSKITSETGGKLDILYHNAGYRSLGLAVESTAEEAFKMFNTNFLGILEMNRLFADMVIRAKGKFIFTGSVSGYTPHPTSSVYVATKAALAIYAETLRIEMKPFDVEVVHVATAAVNTGMTSARLEIAEGMPFPGPTISWA